MSITKSEPAFIISTTTLVILLSSSFKLMFSIFVMISSSILESLIWKTRYSLTAGATSFNKLVSWIELAKASISSLSNSAKLICSSSSYDSNTVDAIGIICLNLPYSFT